jgi:aspartate aminotransferase-like enzyme
VLEVVEVKLLTPGPVEVHERVLRAQARRVISHRSSEFRRLLGEVAELLAELASAEEALLLSGSGTTAVDAMAWSLVAPGERVVVVALGEFGYRLAESLERRGAEVTLVEAREPGPHILERVEELLDRGGYSYIALVHNETSTGVAYRDLEELARIASRYGVGVLVDAVSAYPVEKLRLSGSVFAAATCSHKALAAPPGVAIVLLSREAVELLERRGTPKQTPPLLDLSRYHRFLGERSETPYTPPVTLLYALREALSIISEKGVEAVRREHEERARLLYTMLPGSGLTPLARSPRYWSITVTAFRLPEGVDAHHVVDLVRRRGFAIAAGMGEERKRVIRIGVMGALSLEDVRAAAEAVVEAVERLAARH